MISFISLTVRYKFFIFNITRKYILRAFCKLNSQNHIRITSTLNQPRKTSIKSDRNPVCSMRLHVANNLHAWLAYIANAQPAHRRAEYRTRTKTHEPTVSAWRISGSLSLRGPRTSPSVRMHRQHLSSWPPMSSFHPTYPPEPNERIHRHNKT